jgi:hypothetical protein
MEESSTVPASQGTMSMVLDALTYPLLKRWGWWLLASSCVGADVFLVSLSVISAKLLLLFLFIVGLLVRCYFSVIETTLTGYGEEAWQGNGFSADDLWSSIGTVTGVATMSWAPAIAGYFVLRSQHQPVEPWFSILGMLGCEYFSMAVLGTVVFGSFSGALPHRVIPAIFRSGASYGLAALGLMLVPWSFEWTLPSFISYGLGGVAIAGAVASYFLIAQARLVGLIYLDIKEKIGWD